MFLYGPAAAGKLTVGRSLAALTGYPLFHNHLVVDAVGAVFPFGSPSFVDLRHRFWVDVFREAAREGRSLIFTFTPEPTVPARFLPDVFKAVEGRGRVRFVSLRCPLNEQERRIEDPSRAEFNKLRSRETLLRIRAEEVPSQFEMPPAEVEIDTSLSSPEASAARIVDSLGLRAESPHRTFATSANPL